MITKMIPAMAALVLSGAKTCHVLQDPKNKYKEGVTMQLETLDDKNKQYTFGTAVVSTVESVEINRENNSVRVEVGGKTVSLQVSRFYPMAGFANEAEFWNFFDKPYKGKVVYWDTVQPA
jgi:hypothetical protein